MIWIFIPQTYAKIEKEPDKASIRQAKMLSELFGISVNILFLDINSKVKKPRVKI